ncbi:MAG: DUF1638 domain-containing protein [Planctomycetaceae bacterium]|jgi:hypothetical protein|nr:DUF1638 domain-containing protein [Planctomycetaceae bacterium]
MKLKLFACEIIFREICALAAISPHRIDIEFLPKGLHDIGKKKMRERLTAVLDTVDETQYDAVLLGYGLCSGGTTNLTARTIPLVIPRAHDCITFFLGSRKRYEDYFFANPGVYFKTTGWIERGDKDSQYLEMMPFYNKLTFIETGVEANDFFERATQQLAGERNWEYEKVQGDLTLLRRFVFGDWNEDFLIVQPGQTTQFAYSEDIISAK